MLFRTDAVVLRNTIVCERSDCVGELFRRHVALTSPANVQFVLDVSDLPAL
jgi:hypothetical protein